MPKIPYGQVGKVTESGNNTIRELANCDFFTAKLISLKDILTINKTDSFVSLVVLEGSAKLSWDSQELPLKKGDSIFIPAALQVNLIGEAEILYSCV